MIRIPSLPFHQYNLKAFARLVFLVFALPLLTFGTSYVVVYTPAGIFIGADSLRRVYEGGPPQHGCKIVEGNGDVLLMFGLLSVQVLNTQTGESDQLDLRRESVPIARLHDSVEQKLQLIAPLVDDLMAFHLTKGTAQKLGAQPEIGVVFVSPGGIQGFNKKGGQASWLNRRHGTPSLPDYAPVALGRTDGYDALTKSNELPRLRQELRMVPDVVIRRILDKQSSLTPLDVGPPYSIAYLTNGKLTWIEKGACEERRGAPKKK